MTREQIEYCGGCPNFKKCHALIKNGKDPHCPYAI